MWRLIQIHYLLLSSRWFWLLVNPSIKSVFLSNCMLFCSAISSFTTSVSSVLWRYRGLVGKLLSSEKTPILSQSRGETARGEGGSVISGSTEILFRSLTAEMSLSWWFWFTWVAVERTGSELAYKILNSRSNASTAGPLRMVISCRCRWVSVQVKLQNSATMFWVTFKHLRLTCKDKQVEAKSVYL